ncbi:MAG TPA: methyltransferase domain-containing protein, partial [Pyrinomonadaceae bacterium]|nr:methyltransferase domain-containing protein [Pyrinomonadaceae bacterium]
MTTPPDIDERFESGAPAYAAYLQTHEGRLRLDIAWENLLSVINETGAAQVGYDERGARDAVASRRALDLGGGTGALGLRFAALGWQVALVDPSATMLSLAADAARGQGVAERVTFHQADAERARECFAPQTFDAATCHNVLEYVPDPHAALAALAALVRAGGLVSL